MASQGAGQAGNILKSIGVVAIAGAVGAVTGLLLPAEMAIAAALAVLETIEHEHVVEDTERVELVVLPRQRMVEERSAQVVALTADELQA